MVSISAMPLGGDSGAPAEGGDMKGGKRHGASVKTLKRMLKKAGLKTTGRKAALTRRAKKAHLKMRGGEDCVSPQVKDEAGNCVEPLTGGRKRKSKSRGSKKGKLGLMGY